MNSEEKWDELVHVLDETWKDVLTLLKADPSKKDHPKLLHHSIRYNLLELVKVLREMGSDVRTLNDGKSILFIAFEDEDYVEMCEYVLNWVKDEAPDLLLTPSQPDGIYPEDHAIEYENKFAIEFLKQNTDPAKRQQAKEIAAALKKISKPFDDDRIDAFEAAMKEHATMPELKKPLEAMFCSAISGVDYRNYQVTKKMVEIFLSAGVSPLGYVDDLYGNIIMHICWLEKKNITYVFLRTILNSLLCGAEEFNVDQQRNCMGRTALHLASLNIKHESTFTNSKSRWAMPIALLLAAGADPEIKDNNGEKPSDKIQTAPQEFLTEVWEKRGELKGILEDEDKFRGLLTTMMKWD